MTLNSGEALSAAAERLLEEAKARCPVDSGGLRASGKATAVGSMAEVRFSAPHGAVVHRKICPFLADACADEGLQRELEAILQNRLEFRN